jgi:hypothetical protein
MEYIQEDFGWLGQYTCRECAGAFIGTQPFLPTPRHWMLGEFYSDRFCSQECANASLEERDEYEEIERRNARAWG